MDIVIAKTKSECDNIAAGIIRQQIADRPKSVLGLATGDTPSGLYARLIELYEKGLVDFKDVETFNLDEYRGLSKDHPQSYSYYMHKNLFSKINVRDENIHLPNGQALDAKQECMDYENKIKDAGGIDLQLLGIGRNGHIGFNEPNNSFASMTCLTDLTEDTIEANSIYFDSCAEVPRTAFSMGIKTIMQARKIILLAYGKGKAQAIADSLTGPITPLVPGSVLQLHPFITVLLDEDAASLL